MVPERHPDTDKGGTDVAGDVTRLIERAASGDGRAEEKLLDAIYAELHALATKHLAGERRDLTIGATAIVNEAYLRLFRPGGAPATESWSSRRAFFSVAAQAMRRVLIDHARRRAALVRGGDAMREHLPLDVLAAARDADPRSFLALDDALQTLGKLDGRAAEVVRLRFFAGLTVEQIARVLDIGERTVKRDWEFARAWLQRQLDAPEQGASATVV